MPDPRRILPHHAHFLDSFIDLFVNAVPKHIDVTNAATAPNNLIVFSIFAFVEKSSNISACVCLDLNYQQ